MLTRIMRGSSADLVIEIIDTLFPDAASAIDLTWGHGNFWLDPPRLSVFGIDLDPERAKDLAANFEAVPLDAKHSDVVFFDPPYQTDAGEDAFISARFGSYENVAEMEKSVRAGVREAARLSSLGFVVKVMDHIHGNRLLEMTEWVRQEAGLPLYDYVLLESPSKSENRRWTKNGGPISVRSTATTWMVFRHGGPAHKRRKPATRREEGPPRRFRRLAAQRT